MAGPLRERPLRVRSRSLGPLAHFGVGRRFRHRAVVFRFVWAFPWSSPAAWCCSRLAFCVSACIPEGNSHEIWRWPGTVDVLLRLDSLGRDLSGEQKRWASFASGGIVFVERDISKQNLGWDREKRHYERKLGRGSRLIQAFIHFYSCLSICLLWGEGGRRERKERLKMRSFFSRMIHLDYDKSGSRTIRIGLTKKYAEWIC